MAETTAQRNPHRLIPVLGASIFLLLAACGEPGDALGPAREAIAEALRASDREAALDAISEFRSIAPDTAEAHLEIATFLASAGAAPEALWLLEREYGRFPEDGALRIGLAKVALTENNPSLARQVLEDFPEDSEKHAIAMLTLALAVLDLGDLERGLEIMEEAQRRYPGRPEVHLARVAALRRENRNEEAREVLESARAVLLADEGLAESDYLDITLAQIQAAQGDTEAAIEGLLPLVEEDPARLPVWRTLIQLLAKENRIAEILPLLESAASMELESNEFQTLLWRAYLTAGRDVDAERMLRFQLDASPSPALYQKLASFYSERGRVEEALERIRDGVDRYPEELRLRVALVETLLVAERVDAAAMEVERLDTEAFTHDPYVGYLRARIEIARGDSRAGEQRLLQLLPRLDRAATQFWLGIAHEMQGDFGGAARRFEMAWRRDASWVHAALALIRLDRRRGDWQSLANHGRRLANAMPGVYEAWEALAEALVELGQGEGAEKIAVRMLGLYPERPEPRLLRARAMAAQGRRDDALLVLDKAIELQPTPGLQAERALMLGLSGRIQDGLAEVRASLARYPNSAQLYWTLASLLFANQEGVAGAEAIDRALELDPQQPGPLRTRCEYRQAAGQPAEASADCRRYIALRPDDPEAYYQLALAQAALGETDGAVEAYRRVIELDARDFRPRNNLAELLTQQGDLEGALDEAQHAYRLAENNPYVLDTLGYLYLQKGLVERGASLLEASHAKDPEITGHAFHLALAYQATGRDEDARRLLEQLRKSSLQDPKLRARIEEALHSTP